MNARQKRHAECRKSHLCNMLRRCVAEGCGCTDPREPVEKFAKSAGLTIVARVTLPIVVIVRLCGPGEAAE